MPRRPSGPVDEASPLRRARLARNWTLEDVVEEIDLRTPGGQSGVTPSMVSGWELGRHTTSIGHRKTLCEIYGLLIGYGNAGRAAAKTALALGAEVTVYTRHQARDSEPRTGTFPKFRPLSDPGAADGLAQSDVIIGALRISTFDTPPVVTTDIVQRMRAGSVIIDVTAGFGAGYIQTSAQLTSLTAPYRMADGVKHIKIRTLPLGVHRSAAAQISRIYAPYIYRLIASLHGQSEDPAGQQGKIIAAGQILNPQVRRHYENGFRE
jgi:alanine dehydrogenase